MDGNWRWTDDSYEVAARILGTADIWASPRRAASTAKDLMTRVRFSPRLPLPGDPISPTDEMRRSLTANGVCLEFDLYPNGRPGIHYVDLVDLRPADELPAIW